MRIDTNGPVIFRYPSRAARNELLESFARTWRVAIDLRSSTDGSRRRVCISLIAITAGKQLLERLFGIQRCPPHLRHDRLQQTRAAEADPFELTHVVFPKPLIAAEEKALSKKFVVVCEMLVETNSILGIG